MSFATFACVGPVGGSARALFVVFLVPWAAIVIFRLESIFDNAVVMVFDAPLLRGVSLEGSREVVISNVVVCTTYS